MFTGIIEDCGPIEQIHRNKDGFRLCVRCALPRGGVQIGDSVAANGCCLTVTGLVKQRRGYLLWFDLLRETWERTTFTSAAKGLLLNLERAIPAHGRFGGHFVTGHIDGVAKIKRWSANGKDHLLDLAAPSGIMRYIVFKGSVAIDGISLTVAAVEKSWFRVWIIPHTYEVTALRARVVGDSVNIETDLLGKYVERFVNASGKT